MAKFIQAPVDQVVAEVPPPSLWEDPILHQALAIMALSALATLFVVLLLRGLFMKDRRARQQAAAIGKEGYSGAGLNSAAQAPNQERRPRT